MDWITGIGRAIDYVEEHITEQIDYEEAAKRAYSSSFHFQRVFSVICGYTLGDYVRFRRLALAGGELAADKIKVIDAALKYGYDSPESFSRAFVKFHGVTPTQARNGAPVKSFSRLSVKLIISGGTKMDYRFVKADTIDIVVKRRHISGGEMTGREISQFWRECSSDGTIPSIEKYINENNAFGDSIIGVSLDCVEKDGDFSYGIGCHYNGADIAEDGLEVITLPAADYIVFPCKGKMPEAFTSVYKYIFEEFFPNSEYRPSGVEIEAYPSADVNDTNYFWELWLAVKKK